VDLARSGVAVLVISSDLAELSSLSDRIVALRGGQHAGELARGQVTEAGLLRFITSSEPQPAAA
jgi:ABC-type sugar transport system ATPase subunit